MNRSLAVFLLRQAAFSCLLALALPGLSQSIQIFDADSRAPLAEAYVSAPGLEGHLSDSAGRVPASLLQYAEVLHFRAQGYEPRSYTREQLQQAGFQAYLSPSIRTLDAVVLTAGRWEQRQRETPARVIALRPQDIALQQPQTAADLLAATGEVFVQKSQQGGGSPMIRGFATNRVLLVVDGVRMNTAIFRSGNVQNVISLDPLALERAEVLFGPGSLMYGSDAIGGVMRFETEKPAFALGEEAQVSGRAFFRYASANQGITGHIKATFAQGRWAALTAFTHSDFSDLRMGSRGPEAYLRPFYVERIDGQDRVLSNLDPQLQRPSGYTQDNFTQKLRFRLAKGWELGYGLHYSATSEYARYDRLIVLRNGLPRSADWRYGPQTWMMQHLSASSSQPSLLWEQMRLHLAWQRFGESRFDRNFGSSLLRERVEQVDAYSINLDASRRAGGRGQIFYGIESVRNEVLSEGRDINIEDGYAQPAASRYPNATWASQGAYLNGQLRLGPGLHLAAGARYTCFSLSARFDTALFPLPYDRAENRQGGLAGSLGLTWSLGKRWRAAAHASTGFRAPNVDDLGKLFDSQPGFVVVPNPALGAEQAWHGEAGVTWLEGRLFRLEISAFYTRLNNALVRRNFALNGQDSILYGGETSRVQAVENAAFIEVYGLNASAELSLGNFLFEGRFSFQRGTEELDDESRSALRHAAPAFGVLRLSYREGGLTLQAYGEFSAALPYERLAQEGRDAPHLYAPDDQGNPWAPAWATLNVKMHFEASPALSFSGGIENLTDQRYRVYSSGISAPGRNFILACSARF
jgi:hemoglobin/transferrin/lactoferrin receptor protein